MPYPSETLFPRDTLFPSDLDDEELSHGYPPYFKQKIFRTQKNDDDNFLIFAAVHFIEAIG